MEILITNDDGVFSPGLRAAVNAVKDLGNITVAAPSKQQTATGRSLIGNRNQSFLETEIDTGGKKIKAYHIDCTPALVMKFAFTTIFREKKPDLVISGINYGENIGSDITVSGTLGAAFEASSIGIPAIAASLQTAIEFHHEYGDLDWTGAEYFLNMFTKKFINSEGFSGFNILKIDIPDSADKDTPWIKTSLTDLPYYKNVILDGNITSSLNEMKLELNTTGNHKKGTDAYTVITDRKVSATPIITDMTANNCRDLFI